MNEVITAARQLSEIKLITHKGYYNNKKDGDKL